METEAPIGTLAGSPMLRNLLAIIPVLGLGIWVAANIDTETSTFTILLFGSVLMFALFGILTMFARLEAVILGLLLIGYIVGNRNFAQVAVIQPFYVGEMGLAALLACQAVRFVMNRETIKMKSPLGASILLFVGVCGIRFLFNVSAYRLEAARDFALVYYALFFFAAYQMGRLPESRRFLEQCLVFAFVGLALVAVVTNALADVGFEGLAFLLITFEKGDLVGAFSVAALFFIFQRPKVCNSVLIRWVLLTIFCASIALGIARAAFLALALASILFWIAGIKRFFAYLAFTGIASTVCVLLYTAALAEQSQSERIIELKEKVVSMFDFSGEFKYQSDFGNMKAANNEFRRFFWQSIINETMEDNALVGKGFGYDFLAKFERSYNRGTWEGLRSAHNFYVTLFGRMGIVGLLIFGAITFQIIRGGIQAAVKARNGLLDHSVLACWCGAWAILASGAVGVVLEGPMGAIVFWSLLGLAVSGSEVGREKNIADAEVAAELERRAARKRGLRPPRLLHLAS